MSINRYYIQEIRDEFNYLATWLPTTSVSPGDVGRIINHQYQPLTTLHNLGIPFETIDNHVQADFEYHSSNAVHTTLKAAGQAPIAGSFIAAADAITLFVNSVINLL